MNDPHAVALYYTVKHADNVDYERAVALEYDVQPGFTVRIEKGRVEITMKSHHATAQDARDEVDPFLRVWELTAALQFRPLEFEFIYDHADIIDRQPTPGTFSLAAVATVAAVESLKVHVGRSKYPDPPPP